MSCFQVWDTAGQEKFHSLVPMFYRHASAALLVFDLADRKTFEDLQSWIQGVCVCNIIEEKD